MNVQYPASHSTMPSIVREDGIKLWVELFTGVEIAITSIRIYTDLFVLYPCLLYLLLLHSLLSFTSVFCHQDPDHPIYSPKCFRSSGKAIRKSNPVTADRSLEGLLQRNRFRPNRPQILVLVHLRAHLPHHRATRMDQAPLSPVGRNPCHRSKEKKRHLNRVRHLRQSKDLLSVKSNLLGSNQNQNQNQIPVKKMLRICSARPRARKLRCVLGFQQRQDLSQGRSM